MDNSTVPVALPPLDAASAYLLRTQLAGQYMGMFAYGIHLTLYFLCTYLLLHGKKAKEVAWGWIAFTTLILSVCTVYVGTNVDSVQLLFVDIGYSYPGGPLGAYFNAPNVPVTIAADAAYIVANALTDILMVYRCWIVWDRSFLIVAFPFLLYLASTSLSIVAVVQLAVPGDQNVTAAVDWLEPYFGISMGLNTIITLMIAGKLLYARKRLAAALGERHSRMYTSITAMITESAALYSLFNMALIITFTLEDPFLNILLPTQAQVMAICPLLILIRVARGRAYAGEATYGSTVASMQFAKNNGLNSSREITFATERTYNGGGSTTWGPAETKESA